MARDWFSPARMVGIAPWSSHRRHLGDPASHGSRTNAGHEATALGAARWGGAALSARTELLPWLSVAVRGDALAERAPEGPRGRATPILFPAPRVASQTVTVDAHAGALLRLEYRHDAAGAPLYAARHSTRQSQNTVTLGLAARF